METVYDTIIQESRPDLVLPIKKWKPQKPSILEVDSPSAADKAYWILREKIITLEFSPGSAIRDTDLSRILGFGRTPIREALKRLEVEMLVVSRHRKGTYTEDITLADTRRHYQIRRQLLTLAVALASQSDEQLLARLERKGKNILSNLSAYSLATIFRKIIALDLEFAQASGNPYLHRTLQQYSGYTRRTWHLLQHNLSVEDFCLRDYGDILDWVGKGDGERSSQMMGAHVDAVHLIMVDRFLKTFI